MYRTSVTILDHANIESVLLTLGGFSKFQFWASFAILSPEIPAAMIAMLPVFVGSDHASNFDTDSPTNTSLGSGSIFDAFTAPSVVAEWELRGSSAWITEMFTSLYMAGMMSGAISASQLADRFGRRKIHFLLILTMSSFGVLSALAPNPWIYGVLRFFAGVGVGGFYCIYSIYLMEFLTPSYRVICGSISFWFAGEILLALLAYLIPSWRLLSLAASLPAFLGLCTIPWMPETPRWLLCHSLTPQAGEVLSQIASWNGTPPPSASTLSRLQAIISSEEAASSASSSSSSLANLISNFRLRLAIFLSLFFSVAFCYYGITFNAKNLSGHPSLNMGYMGIIDMIAFPAGSLFSNALGRRRVTVLFLGVAAAPLLLLMGLELTFPDLEQGWVTGLCFLGRFGVAGAWGVVVCFCQECFPTVVRSTALGLCCLAANTGGVLAPQVAFVGTVWPLLPHAVFTGFILLSGGMAWMLPEMRGKPLENF